MASDFVYVGGWSGRLMIYDARRQFKLVKYVKCKQAVRALCCFSDSILIVGQNEGWIELVDISELNKMDVISTKRFDSLGHVF